MRITILNGDMEQGESAFSLRVQSIATKISKICIVDVYPLYKMNLHFCKGCWSCWWKTPGECAIHDDGSKIFLSAINSDLIIFASPILAGFTSSALKKITDRLIVLLHPYFALRNGEYHHQRRYSNYPDFGLLLKREPDTDLEDIKIINDIYDRIANNFYSKRKFTYFIEDDNIEETLYETCNN